MPAKDRGLSRPRRVHYFVNGSSRLPDGSLVKKSTPGAVPVVTASKVWYGRYADANGKVQRVPLYESKQRSQAELDRLRGEVQRQRRGLDPKPAVDGRPFNPQRPVSELLEEFGQVLRDRGNSAGHVARVPAQARAVLDGCGVATLGELAALSTAAVSRFLAERRFDAEPAPLPKGQEWFTLAEVVALTGLHWQSVGRILSRHGLAGEGHGRKRRFGREAVEVLQREAARGVGVSTINAYTVSVKAFTRWLSRGIDRRLAADPLADLRRVSSKGYLRVERRHLPPNEFAALLEAARTSPRRRRGLAGTDRHMIYLLAARTGLREAELASLTPASFDLTAGSVRVRAGYTKNGEEAVLPLRDDIAQALRGYLAGRSPPRPTCRPGPNQPLWPGTWSEDGAEILRGDLRAAGIPYYDAEGRRFDFHALRHQFISDLAEAGVHPKEAQVLARHSTISLTLDRYTHVRAMNLKSAVEKLPGTEPAGGTTVAPQKSSAPLSGAS